MVSARARADANSPSARRLNSRQLDTLFLICKGLRNAEIGTQLQVSERTVKGYVAQLLLIFDVTNRTELAATALEMNVLKDSAEMVLRGAAPS